MTSLATCIRRAGKALTREDADAVREIMAEGATAEQAVDEYLGVLAEERQALAIEIRQAGADPAALAPEQPRLTVEEIEMEENLSPRLAAIKQRFTDEMTNRDWVDIVAEYQSLDGTQGPENTENGKINSVDAWRELSADYRADRSTSAAVHEVASAMSKKYFNQRMSEPVAPFTTYMLWTSGGTGAGKTTGLGLSEFADESEMINDSNLAKFGSAVRKIDQALDAGRLVDINHVVRDPIEALENGAVIRAIRQEKQNGTGRVVPLSVHVGTHVGAADVVKQLHEHYKNDQRVHFEFTDNTNGKGNAVAGTIDSVLNLDRATLMDQGRRALQEIYTNGHPRTGERLSDALYYGFIEQEAPTDAGAAEDVSREAGARAQEFPEGAEPEGQRDVSGLRQASLQLALAPAIRSLSGTVRVNIAQSTTDLPGAAIPSDVEGMYRGGNEIWLVADNLPTAARAKKVLAHEAFGHLAMERQPEFTDVLASVKNMLASGNRTFIDVAETVAVTQGNLDEDRQAKEILAVMVENDMTNGIVDQAIAGVRSMLRRMGFLDGVDYSEAEIKALLVRAAKDLVSDAQAKQAALKALPLEEQILTDPDAVESSIYLAVKEVYANAAMQDMTVKIYNELETNDTERSDELRQALYRAKIKDPSLFSRVQESTDEVVAVADVPGAQSLYDEAAAVFSDTEQDLFSRRVTMSGPGQEAKAFMDRLWEETQVHPFDGSQRISRDATAMIEARPVAGDIHLSAIQSLYPGERRGGASRLIDKVLELSNETGVRLTGTAKQFGTAEGTLSTAKLKAWYKRKGFRVEGDRVVYTPPNYTGSMPEDELFSRSSLMKVRPSRFAGELRDVDVLKNPSGPELARFAADIRDETPSSTREDPWNADRPGLRWARSTEGDFYFWDAYDGIHSPMVDALDITQDPGGPLDAFSSEDIITKEDILEGKLRGYQPAIPQRPRPQPSQRPLFARAIHSDPEIERIRAKALSPALEDITVKDRIRAVVDRVRGVEWLGIKQGIIDSSASVEELEVGLFGELLDASESAYKSILSTRNLGSVMAAIMHRGIPIYQNGVFTARTGRKGLVEIFEPITHHEDGNLLALWELYAAAKRSQRLIGERNPDGTAKEKVFTQAEINKALTLETQYPEFKTAFLEWQKFNSQLLDLAIKQGVINGEEAKIWRQNDYVPFYRAMEDIEYDGGQGPQTGRNGVANVRSGIKRLTGSEAQIGNVFENMVMNTAYLTDAIYRNTAMQRVVAMADGVAMEKIPMAWEAVKFKDGDIARALMRAGLIIGNGSTEADMFNDGIRQVKAMTTEQKEHWSTLFRRVAPKGDNVVSVLIGGKPVYYEVQDPLLFRSLAAMGAQQWGGIMHTFRFAKRTLTKAVTIDPAFMMANFIRDTLSTAVIQTGSGVKQVTGAMAGLKAAWNEDPEMLDMMMAGAGGGGFYDHNPADVRKMLAKRMPAGEVNSFSNSVLTPRGLWRFWQKIGNASEQANRVAVYKRIIAEGGTPAEAAHQARDVLNFTMAGDYNAMKFLVQTVPFLNARVQGLYRLYRGGRENPVGFAMKGGAITAASMALLLKNLDDERFRELPEWDKDTYWHFFIGDEHFRLPKPFEVGAIFATVPERAFMLGTGDDSVDIAIERAWRMVSDTFAFNPVPQAIKPIIEQYANRNMFTGNPIIGLAHQGLDPEAQYDPWTSETMRELSKIMPDTGATKWLKSPKRLESLMRGYFGAIGMYTLGASDAVTRRAFGHPERPSRGIRNYPVLTRFWRDPNPRTSKYSSQLYDMLGEADSLYKTMNAYRNQRRVDEAAAMLEENRGKLAARAFLHDVSSDVRKINKQIRLIQYSNATPESKKERIDKLYKAKLRVMRRVSTVSDIF